MEKQNTISAKSYMFVFLGLVVLTLLSTALSTLNMGYLNIVLTFGLAVVSALVVLAKFMNVKLNGAFARLLLAGVLALALLIFFVAFVG